MNDYIIPARSTVYLAGPMRNVFGFNFLGFHYWTEQLTKRGYTVINPAQLDIDAGDCPPASGLLTDSALSFSDCMARDLPEVCRADCLFAMPGWLGSQGARMEVSVTTQLGKRVYDKHTVLGLC